MHDLVSLQRTLYNSRNPTRRWLHTSRRDIIIDAIKRAPVPTSARALEVGPGSGVYLPTLCDRFETVSATDIEPMHINALRAAFPDLRNLQLIIHDLCQEDWPEQFDLVLCSEVVEHVTNPDEFMGGLSKAVRSGGILILSTPQPWSLMELTASIALSPLFLWLARLIYREPVLPTGHINVQSSNQLTQLLRTHDFKILETSHFGLYVPCIAEFGGAAAVPILSALERMIKRHGPRSLLWTQMHIAQKSAPIDKR